MIRNSGDHLFLDPRTFPTREVPIKINKPRRTAHPVVRVLTPWKGGTTRHVQVALAAFLGHPAKLPLDPGSGPHPLAARLDLVAVGKGMAIAKEPSRAAFIRRVLAWRYFARKIVAIPQKVSSKPIISQKPNPSGGERGSAVAPAVCLPRCPVQGSVTLKYEQVEGLFGSYGYFLMPQSNCSYALFADGSIRVTDSAGNAMQKYTKPFFG